MFWRKNGLNFQNCGIIKVITFLSCSQLLGKIDVGFDTSTHTSQLVLEKLVFSVLKKCFFRIAIIAWPFFMFQVSLSFKAEKVLEEKTQEENKDVIYFWARLGMDGGVTGSNEELTFWSMCDVLNGGCCRYLASNSGCKFSGHVALCFNQCQRLAIHSVVSVGPHHTYLTYSVFFFSLFCLYLTIVFHFLTKITGKLFSSATGTFAYKLLLKSLKGRPDHLQFSYMGQKDRQKACCTCPIVIAFAL